MYSMYTHFQDNNRHIILLFVFAFLSLSPVMHGQIKFSRSYGNYPVKFIRSGGYYILGGNQWSSGPKDIFLLQLDEFGDTLRSDTYVQSYENTPVDFITVDSTGFLILGRSSSNDVSLIRVDQNGDTLWTRLFVTDAYDPPAQIVRAGDGGYVITGFTRVGDYLDILLLKTDANGKIIWLKTYGGTYSDAAYNILLDNDGGYLITGYYDFDGTTLPCMLKTDADGDSLWIKEYSFGWVTGTNAMIRTSDGGLMIAGLTSEASLTRTTGSGDTIWTRSYNVEGFLGDAFRTVIQTSDGGYLAGGAIDNQYSTRPDYSTLGIFKFDSVGNLEWYRSLSDRLGGSWKSIVCVYEMANSYKFLSNEGHLFSTDKNGCFTQNPVLDGIGYFCSGDSTALFTTGEFNSYLWSTGDVSDTVYIDAPGGYFLIANDTLNCPVWSDTIMVSEEVLPVVDVVPDESSTICDGDSVRLVAGISNYDPQKEYQFHWNFNASLNDEIHVRLPGSYSVLVTDDNGCMNSDSILVSVHYPYQEEKICVVTVSLSSGKNLIVWEKTPDQRTASYNIYRDRKDNLIGNVPYSDLSVFIDTTVNPETRPYLYYLSLVDSCGNESELSPYHKPHFLQYVGSTGGINLSWDKYEIEGEPVDFGSYTLYRGSESYELTPIEENIPVVISVFTDKDPQALERKYYYRVAGELISPCAPSVGKKSAEETYQFAMSNQEDNKVATLVNELFIPGNILIHPNPVTSSAAIEFSNPSNDPYRLSVIDISGKTCRVINGITSPEFMLERGDLEKGLYFLELRGPKTYRGKMMVE
jgi:hypothetical protein